MPLREQLENAATLARKAKDRVRLSTIQLVLSSLKNEQIAAQKELTDEQVIAVLNRHLKQSRDALADFVAAGRDDLREQTEQEIAVLEEFMPAQMRDEELEELVRRAIAETGATSAAEMGKVMGNLMPRVQGKADGTRVRTVVARLLS